MTTSQRELLLLLAAMVSIDPNVTQVNKAKIQELIAEINIGSQDIR